ncbi:helix-turn-helix transcriptional regulator [Archaeoglobus neptunius]|uniref:helix-turn-helix transcriptional regulator n=1 Tax=Archaeoglobus neptunius TaxID=2798580 RepID=UPI001E3CAAFB|nr:MarR family transcriptional regulator [Archaeoglobus neptunius]
MELKIGKASPMAYLLALLGAIMLIFFLLNMFPPYPSYPLGCVEMGGQYITLYQNFLFLFAAIALFFTAVLLTEKDRKGGELKQDIQEQKASGMEENRMVASGNGTLELIQNLLERDELTVMKIILENDGITQDSLHFRTGFSHSKISMIVKKLEEKNLIVRERFGKTYRIHLSEWLRGLLGSTDRQF